MKRFIAALLLLISTLTICVETIRAQYNQDYFYWVSRQRMIHNDYQGAISVLNMLLSVNDRLYEGYFLRGVAKYNLGDLIGAEADFSIALEKNPVFTTAFTYRAITRSRLGNYNDALTDFKEAIELRPDIASPYYSRGVTRLLNGQYVEAIEDFDLFIRSQNRVPDAYINRGISYLQLRDTLEAYNNFDMAIKTNRENPESYNRRGGLYMRQSKFEEAEADFTMAIQYDSTYIPALFNRALVYNDTKRPMDALGDLDRVLEIDSTSSISYFNRAIVRSQVGDYNRALEDYNVVAKYLPDNVLVFFYRANLLSRLGKVEDAESDYTRAIELYPDFANAYMSRSNIRYILRNAEGAKRDRDTAERKIAEHRSKLKDSTYSIYNDTTYSFDRLLSFDTNLTGSNFEKITTSGDGGRELDILPMFKFSLMARDTTTLKRDDFYASRVAAFVESMPNVNLELTCLETNIPLDSLESYDRRSAELSREVGESVESIFSRSIVQLLMRQYTRSMQYVDFAINAINAENPFFWFNRATVRAEMIDFISSLDNSSHRISVDTDPANRLRSTPLRRSYSYAEAEADLNRCIELYPTFAHPHYNRGNILVKSGELPEAYEAYSRAIELYPQFGEAYYNRGIIQIYMEDRGKGILDISKAGELGITEAYEILKEYSTKR